MNSDFNLSTFFTPAMNMSATKKEMSDTEALATEVNKRFNESIRKGETIGISVWKYSAEAVSDVAKTLEEFGYVVSLDERTKNMSIKML